MRYVLPLVFIFLALPALAAPLSKAELTELVQKLAARDELTREQAMSRIITLQDARAVPLLVPLCRHYLAAPHAGKALGHLGKPGVDALLALRNDAEKGVRLRAIDGLGWSKDQRAIAALKAALRHPDAEFRCKALHALQRCLPAAEHRQLALNMLGDDAPSCRITAVIVLREAVKGDRALFERMLAMANDPSPRVRDIVLNDLSLCYDPRLYDAFCKYWLLGDDFDHVERAVSWLGSFGDPRAAPLLRKVYDRWIPLLPAPGMAESAEYPRNYMPDLLERLTGAMACLDDPEITAFLYTLTKDPHPLIRRKAAGAFLQLADPRAPGVMAAVLRDPDAQIREELYGVTYRFAAEPAVQEAARAMCADANPATRARGLRLVRFTEPEEALRLIEQALADDDAAVREQAIARMSTVDDPRAVERLLALEASPDAATRLAALRALCHINDPRAFELLRAQAASPDTQTRRAVLSGACSTGNALAVDLLLPVLQAPSEDCRWLLMIIQYARISDPRLDAALLALLPHTDWEHRYYIYRHFEFNPTKLATPVLLQALNRETDEDLRYTILEALGNAGDPAAADALLALVRNPKEVKLHQHAYEALGKTRDPHALPLLLAQMQKPGAKWGVIRGLGQFQGREVYEALLPLVHHPNPNYRELGLSYLGSSGDPRALPVLIAALERRESMERHAAAYGLLFMGSERAAAAVDPLIAALARMRMLNDRHPFARALTVLTGQDFGTDAERWQAWRRETAR